MSQFNDKRNEKVGQRRKRFLQFLRDLPLPNAQWDEKLKKWTSPTKGASQSKSTK